MIKRREELINLKSYTDEIDKELTMILQSIQWDRNHLLQKPMMVTCQYDASHKIPPDKTEEHEKECFLKQNGYTSDDQLLPDPPDTESNTLIKLRKEDIEFIIGNAAKLDPTFKKGVGCRGAEPMSLARLQSSYSADERRVIHDAVVSAVPSCHDLTDLALLSGGDETSSRVILSRTDILVQLRNMRRRRTKYRVAAKTRNYSDVLRDVIRTQMEHYGVVKSEPTPNEMDTEDNNQTDSRSDCRYSTQASREDDTHRHERRREPSRPLERIRIKRERDVSSERYQHNNRREGDKTFDRKRRYNSQRDKSSEREKRYNRQREQSPERKRHYNRRERDYSSDRNRHFIEIKSERDVSLERNIHHNRERADPSERNRRYNRESDYSAERHRHNRKERDNSSERKQCYNSQKGDSSKRNRETDRNRNYRERDDSLHGNGYYNRVKRERDDSLERNRDYSGNASDRDDECSKDRYGQRHAERSEESRYEGRSHKHQHHSRKRKHDDSYERRKHDSDIERYHEQSHENREYDLPYKVKEEPEEYEEEQSKVKRHHKKKDKKHKHKHHRHKEKKTEKRSKERKRERTHEEVYPERVSNIKQERDSVASDDRTNDSYDRRCDRSYSDSDDNYSSDSSEDRSSEEINNLNKIIKQEK